MKVTKTNLDGVLIIEPKVRGDPRGLFKEFYQAARYRQIGIDCKFVQDNYSRSKKGVLRGMHFQTSNPQGKLVSCFFGAVYDVILDVDPKSPNFGEYVGVEISEENHRQIWVPPGYAHGFCVLSDYADFFYKCTTYYDPTDEGGVVWNDPDVAIKWPVERPLVSEKDALLGTLNELDI